MSQIHSVSGGSSSSSSINSSIAKSERFLGTITQEMQDSSHVSIVDETSDHIDMESPVITAAAPRPKVSRGHSARSPTRRSRSPTRSKSSEQLPSRRSKSPNNRSGHHAMSASMADRSTSNRGTSSRRPMNRSFASRVNSDRSEPTTTTPTGGATTSTSTSTSSMNRSYVSRANHNHLAGTTTTAGGMTSSDDDENELQDFDDDDDFDVKASTPNTSQRGTSSTPSTPSRRSFWKNKSREAGVDQRVNLMDAETGQYERQASTRGMGRGGRMGMGFRQKSLVDIFLHDDRDGGGGGHRGSDVHASGLSLHDSLSSLNMKEGGRGYVKWIVACFLLCLLVGAILTIPAIGIVGGGDDDSKPGPAPAPAPAPTNAPTPAPTPKPTEAEAEEEVKLEPEQEQPQEVGVDIDPQEEGGGGSSLIDFLGMNQDNPVSVTSPNPTLDTAAIPTESRQEALKFLVLDQDISESQAFKDADSPQSQALQWIANEDAAQLDIPGVDKVEDAVQAERQLVQRYALAVFFFSQQAQLEDEEGARRRMAEATKEEVANRRQFDQQWTTSESVCKWPGVSCNPDDFVTELDMSNSLLGGTLPREVLVGSAFPGLSTLDVSQNQLQGTLPRLYESNAVTARSMLPWENALEFLFLQQNQLNGDIESILTLKRLTYADLSSNEFTGTIPAALGSKLRQLDTLHLARNYLQGTLPPELGSAPELARLDLEENLFTGTIPKEWSELTGLEMLSLAHCDTIEGTIPSAIAKMTSLEYLSLQETSIKGPIPSFLGDLDNLNELYLHSTELTGGMPESVCSRVGEDGLQALTSDCSDLGSVECECCTDCFWR